MGLRDEIQPFVDKNNLVAPSLVSPGTIRASSNGVMYTSEYFIILKKLNQLISTDQTDFQARIGQCIDSQGILCRVPIGQTDSLEQVDDYIGSINGCKQMSNTVIPRQFLKALIKNFGFMDSTNPGSKSNWAAFLARQPQLIAAMVAAAFPSFSNPLHFFIRLLAMPLFLVAAVTLLISCYNAPISDTDSRRLSWHLWQATKPVSLMCWLAGKVWARRLYRDYPNGMRGVASLYYQPGHPFIEFWVTD